MTSNPLVVFGAGGHGKVVADILVAQGAPLLGFLDDVRPPGSIVLGLPVLGGSAWLAQHPAARVALGIGDNDTRARIAASCHDAGAELVVAIHPRAVVSPSARVAEGVSIMALAVVNADAIVERGAILNTGSIIEHDCLIGAFAHISPGATLGGGCRIGTCAHLGIGATMLPGTSLGEHSLVGGGSLVARDIPPRAIVKGVPARLHRER